MESVTEPGHSGSTTLSCLDYTLESKGTWGHVLCPGAHQSSYREGELFETSLLPGSFLLPPPPALSSPWVPVFPPRCSGCRGPCVSPLASRSARRRQKLWACPQIWAEVELDFMRLEGYIIWGAFFLKRDTTKVFSFYKFDKIIDLVCL